MKLSLFTFILVALLIWGCNREGTKEQKGNQNFESSIDSGIISPKQALPVKKLKFDIQINPDSVQITHYAVVNTTFGSFTIALFGQDAPKTVNNFVKLAKSGYFNQTLIHRIAKNFLVQMGDGSTRFLSKKGEWGKGGKSIYGGYFADELNPNTYSFRTGYTYGTVAMANSGPNKNLSQFFICLDEAQYLEKKYTIFGKVVEGMDVVEQIETQEIISYKFDTLDGTPKHPIKILSIKILNNK